MPVIQVETRRGWRDDKTNLLSRLRDHVAAALGLPASAFTMRWAEHDDDDFLPPPDRGARYALVTVLLSPGRPETVKNELLLAIANALRSGAVPAHDIDAHLIEIPASHWLVRGAAFAG